MKRTFDFRIMRAVVAAVAFLGSFCTGLKPGAYVKQKWKWQLETELETGNCRQT